MDENPCKAPNRMRYSLRALMTMLTLAPPLLAGLWFCSYWLFLNRSRFGVFLASLVLLIFLLIFTAISIVFAMGAALIIEEVHDRLSGKQRR